MECFLLLCFMRDSRSPGYESHILLPATLSLLKYSYKILGSCSSNSHEGKKKAAILSTGWTSTQVKLWHWFQLWGLPDVIGDAFPHECTDLVSWALGELSNCSPRYGCFLQKVAWSKRPETERRCPKSRRFCSAHRSGSTKELTLKQPQCTWRLSP